MSRNFDNLKDKTAKPSCDAKQKQTHDHSEEIKGICANPTRRCHQTNAPKQ